MASGGRMAAAPYERVSCKPLRQTELSAVPSLQLRLHPSASACSPSQRAAPTRLKVGVHSRAPLLVVDAVHHACTGAWGDTVQRLRNTGAGTVAHCHAQHVVALSMHPGPERPRTAQQARFW